MHENKGYRPWYIARSLEFCYGLIGVGAVTVVVGWSAPYIATGSALILVGLIALAALSLYVSKCERAEIHRLRKNDS